MGGAHERQTDHRTTAERCRGSVVSRDGTRREERLPEGYVCRRHWGGLATIEVDSESYGGRTARMIRLLVVWGERALALSVVAAVLAFAVDTSREIARSDWRDADSINRSIGSALLVGIGFELARLLVTHELVAVLELMAFALARKILTPGLGASEMLLIVLAFVVIFWTRRYFVTSTTGTSPHSEGVSTVLQQS